MDKREPLAPKHGGYRKLKSFQIAQLVHDVTVRFCIRCIDRRSRAKDDVSGGTALSTKSTPSTYPEFAANAALVLIAVASGLLDRQIAAQSAAFEEQGGFTERMYRFRTERRKR